MTTGMITTRNVLCSLVGGGIVCLLLVGVGAGTNFIFDNVTDDSALGTSVTLR